MTDDDLEKRVRRLEALVEALQTQNRRLKRVLAGDPDEFSAWDVEEMVPIHDRIEEVEETVGDHADRFEMFVVEEGSQGTPDQRAMHLRQVLLNQAKRNDSPVAKLKRDQAASALGGDLHRSSVLDAMRRAAGGGDADVDGTCDLQPVDGIGFSKGASVGKDGEPRQSYLLIDTGDLTGDEARQILTVNVTPDWIPPTLGNPILDDDLYAERSLSTAEREFYVDHVAETHPAEYDAMQTVAEAITEGIDRPQPLSTRVGTLVDEWTEAQANTARSGLVGRMSELGFVERTRVGARGVGYELTSAGESEFL